ncbi:MAG: MarR family winged helix-turn-helix transcriptional regulator [Ignavibacteriales bacterium]
MEQTKNKIKLPMDYNLEKERKSQVKMLAELTFELARTCYDRELSFAERFDLTPAEFKLLCYFRHTDTMSIKDLVKEMKLTPGRVTHIITSLENKKLISRNINPEDRRGINVFLTSKSVPLIKEFNDSNLRIHSDILSNLENDKLQSVVCTLQNLIKKMKK